MRRARNEGCPSPGSAGEGERGGGGGAECGDWCCHSPCERVNAKAKGHLQTVVLGTWAEPHREPSFASSRSPAAKKPEMNLWKSRFPLLQGSRGAGVRGPDSSLQIRVSFSQVCLWAPPLPVPGRRTGAAEANQVSYLSEAEKKPETLTDKVWGVGGSRGQSASIWKCSVLRAGKRERGGRQCPAWRPVWILGRSEFRVLEGSGAPSSKAVCPFGGAGDPGSALISQGADSQAGTGAPSEARGCSP